MRWFAKPVRGQTLRGFESPPLRQEFVNLAKLRLVNFRILRQVFDLMRKPYFSSETNAAPLSGAFEVNGMLFVSGQIHLNESGKLIEGSIEEKLEAVIINVKRHLDAAGFALDDVVKVNLYLTDLNELSALNIAYVKYFSHPLPARTAIGVSMLPLGASLEMDV